MIMNGKKELTPTALILGGLLRLAFSRRRGDGAAKAEEMGTLFSAGLVAGEGLCGVILAVMALS